MVHSSQGLMSAADGGGNGRAQLHRSSASFDDENPFQRDLTDEHDSFINVTADSYSNSAGSPFADSRSGSVDDGLKKQPLAEGSNSNDNGKDSVTKGGHEGAKWATASSGYDSFGSQDDDDDSEDDSYSDSDYSSGDEFDDEDNDAYREPTDGENEEDTQRLLVTSSNTKLGGMGMGMRVGETGTGTMISLDLEPHEHRTGARNGGQDGYDTLPLTTFDVRSKHGRSKHDGDRDSVEGIKAQGKDQGRGPKSKRGKRKRRREHGETAALGLGAIRKEQIAMLAKKQFRVQMLWNAFYVFAWYTCSTALSFYNKWLFSPNYHNFQFPLFTTSLHMVAQFTLSSITLALLPAFRPKAAPSTRDFGTKILPCAVASGLDIGLSNSSLKTITLAFYTMCKSSSLAFVLMFAFAFKLERPTWTLAGVIGVICVGLFMMVMSEVDFVLIGFVQVMMASVLGGLRWSLTQILLERTDTKSGSLANPISTIFFLSPIMGVCLCIVAAIFEGYGTIFGSEFFATPSASLSTLGLLFLGGVFAFAMVLAEFNLIARTSVVTLSILGIVKEVVTIVISSMVFHDQLTLVNILGLFITLTGIAFYHFMKLREMKAKTRRASKSLADAELAKAAKKKARAKERKLLRGQRRAGHGCDGGDLRPETHPSDEPWNHSLARADAAKKDGEAQDSFVLDEDEQERK
ncbi:Triose-phosphate Transporter [Mortierella polycephala]|uniref:Triose-phosphate Transporter n=1 Tax=Mortierella polycephala TaxID=41804 RepID=A0A9P6PQV3_9FUNG|nr:Triose-phosphate Transporter [Mortierella polycephala]